MTEQQLNLTLLVEAAREARQARTALVEKLLNLEWHIDKIKLESDMPQISEPERTT